jgi:hypothetical protein
MALYQPLFEGPLDIIGDIHGEIDALRSLLHQLGYDTCGHHPQGRRLVFLGDLTDRGPDSPAVVDTVMTLVEKGYAQCVLGNHELNILLDRPLHGNGWMIQPNPKEKPGELHSRNATEAEKERYRDFFEGLPLVLENTELRIVHACWNQSAVDQILAKNNVSAKVFYQEFQARYEEVLQQEPFAANLSKELAVYGEALRNANKQPPLLAAIAEKERLEQMMNPFRTITTSSMVAAKQPFYGGGKWRMAERDAWWDRYTDEKTVVIGHFWRQFSRLSDRISGVFGRDLFDGIEPHAWMGPRKNVYCVDYSVGQRHLERKNESADYYGKLAALRMPERSVMHDDGAVIDTTDAH